MSIYKPLTSNVDLEPVELNIYMNAILYYYSGIKLDNTRYTLYTIVFKPTVQVKSEKKRKKQFFS